MRIHMCKVVDIRIFFSRPSLLNYLIYINLHFIVQNLILHNYVFMKYFVSLKTICLPTCQLY